MQQTASKSCEKLPTSDQLMWRFAHGGRSALPSSLRIISYNHTAGGRRDSGGHGAPGTTVTSCQCVTDPLYGHQCGMNRLLFPAQEMSSAEHFMQLKSSIFIVWSLYFLVMISAKFDAEVWDSNSRTNTWALHPVKFNLRRFIEIPRDELATL